MNYQFDLFNGVIIDASTAPTEISAFQDALSSLVYLARAQQKNLLWLTLDISQAAFIPVATALGFVFHSCLEQQLTLIQKAPTTSFVPFIPTHTLGAGAIVQNEQGDILVIHERGQRGYKLPGGHVDPGEPIHAAVVREVYEETGIKVQFQSVVGFTGKDPYRLGKANLYFICKAQPLTYEIAIQDTDEIIDAKWLSPAAFMQDNNNALFNRQLIQLLTNTSGLQLIDLAGNEGPHYKHEIYFMPD